MTTVRAARAQNITRGMDTLEPKTSPQETSGGRGERREGCSMPVWYPTSPSQRQALLKGDTELYFLF